MKIDNYALTLFQACPAKYDLRIVQRWTSKRKSAALGFGGAFHHGLAAWYRSGGSRVDMLAAINNHWPDGMPVDDYRTKQKCADTLIAYTREYPGETFQVSDGASGKLIEVSFTLPTGLYLYCPTCGPVKGAWQGDLPALCGSCANELEEIEYGGIFDGLVEFSGAVYVLEHKTTSQLGAGYFDQFRPNNQVTGYTWGAGLLSGKRVGGALINAIGVYKSSPPKFERQITMRSEEEIAEWLRSVHATCERIQFCRLAGYFPLQTMNCTMYGKCEFHAVHSLPYPQQRIAILEQDYQRSEWDYEGRDD